MVVISPATMHRAGGDQGFAGDARGGVVGEDGIENGVADLIGDLIGMPFGHGLRRENVTADVGQCTFPPGVE